MGKTLNLKDMKQIWAPWRAEYIQAEKSSVCIFCAAPKKAPKEGLVLYKGNISVVMLNKYPYNSGHIMIAPLRHISSLEELNDDEAADLFRLMRHSTASLTKAFNPGGFNIGLNLGKAAGAGIEQHIHLHVVPRWNGDMNFMPVLGDVKVIPEHLHQTLAKLTPFFEHI